ncbi:MAG TPA: hypothetical protein VGR67_02455 [Candidatus Polarisedimenticolia bacterium]|jgi:hypothetical protein|nr:hypothetical protein [Candidatus Polarisedimenticolia bacterium]
MPALDLQKHRRELILGGVLVATLAFFLYYRAGSSEAGAGEQAVFVTAPPAAVTKALAQLSSVKLPSVMLDRLQEGKAPYDPTQRNIFRYGNIPPPPPSPEELARIDEARRQAEAARQAAIRAEQENLLRQKADEEARAKLPPIDPSTGLPFGQTPPPPPRPSPPAISLRYSGVLGAAENRMAVLYSGQDVILARVGDTVEKQFKVLDIGYDWVKIGYVDPQFADQYQKLRMGP